MTRFLWLPFLVLILVLSGASPEAAPAGASGATGGIQGDVNCDEVVNAIDSLQILRAVAGLSVTAECLMEAGDANCSSVADSVDALRILRYVASLPTNTQAGCEEIGQALPGGARGEARQLAIEVLGADADEARYDALLKVMEMLRIGVYTSEGGEVQQGAERGPGDFYLYDFELRMMAASLGRGDHSWGVQQIADTLDQVGYREDGQPFTAEDLNQILHGATVDSLAAPEEESSFVPILVRELGVRHEMLYDLAEDLDVDDARFDALQMALILWSLTLPVIAEDGPLETPASTLVANSNGILTAQPVGLTDFCSDFKSEGQELWTATKYFLTAVAVINKVAKAVGVAGFIDLGHGIVLAFSVRVTALNKVVGPTHYDHGPESPGENLKFQIEVWMRDNLGEILVKCGWLATADFPAQGGIPGVRVQFNAYSSSLEDHGTLDCTGLFCSRMTDNNGIATLTFDPKSENEPYGQGDEWLVGPGSLEAIAWYQSRFKNIFGTVAQFVTPKGDEFTWFVEFHGCPPAYYGTNAAQLANGAGGAARLVASAADPSEGLPCAYEGTASAVHNFLLPDGILTYTVTASDLRFELKESNPAGANYEVVRGKVAVTFSGTVDDCTISGSSSIPEPIDDGVHGFDGAIVLDVQNDRYAASGGAGDYENHVVWTCPDEVHTGPVGAFGVVLTFDPLKPVYRPFTPGEPLEGSFDLADPLQPLTSHYEWSFEPIICSTGPAPVCDVPAAARAAPSQRPYPRERALPD